MRLRRPTLTRQGRRHDRPRGRRGRRPGALRLHRQRRRTPRTTPPRPTRPAAAAGSNDEAGDTVTIGFSAPAADHGWMAAITNNVRDLAGGVPRHRPPDRRGHQRRQPADQPGRDLHQRRGRRHRAAALRRRCHDARSRSRRWRPASTVINVDREFDDPNAARVTVLGDNYGMGVSAGQYMCEQLGDNPDAVIAEIAGIDSLPLTQDRSQGFEDALVECGLEVSNRVAADFTVEGGEEAAANLLQAAPKIDGLWNHDDDQGVGVLAAIENAGRDEFFMVGGAGSANAMREIQRRRAVSSRRRSSTRRPRAPTA